MQNDDEKFVSEISQVLICPYNKHRQNSASDIQRKVSTERW